MYFFQTSSPGSLLARAYNRAKLMSSCNTAGMVESVRKGEYALIGLGQGVKFGTRFIPGLVRITFIQVNIHVL